jgi:hypothetical protein
MKAEKIAQKVVVICVAILFLMSSIVHWEVFIRKRGDISQVSIVRVLIASVDLIMAGWLAMNVNNEMLHKPSVFLNLMVVRAFATPSKVDQIMRSNLE